MVEYKFLDRLEVKPNLTDINNISYNAKTFKRPEDICTYNPSLERELINKLSVELSDQKIVQSAEAAYSMDSYMRNEEILKSLAELKEEISSPRPTTPETHFSSTLQSQTVNSHTKNTGTSGASTNTACNETILRMKGGSAAELYLGTDDAGAVVKFLDFYVSTAKLILNQDPTAALNDPKIVQAYKLFDTNPEKAKEFVLVSEELVELGFDEDRVTSALLLHDNDRESSLDFLMKE